MLRSFITYVLQFRPYLLPKYEMMAINLLNLGHALTDFRNETIYIDIDVTY